MKKKFVAFALLLGAIVSVTSGCVVRGDGYGHGRYRHDRYHNGGGYNDNNGGDHGHYHDDNRGY